MRHTKLKDKKYILKKKSKKKKQMLLQLIGFISDFGGEIICYHL